MKKITVLFLIVSMIFSSFMSANAAKLPERITCGEYTYVKADGGVVITECDSEEKVLVVPDKLDGEAVVGIERCAFYKCKDLREITLPNSITEIHRELFSGCENIEKITVPDSVSSIGESAFAGCENLKEINIPENVKNIDYGAFAFCKDLENISIPKSCEKITHSAFQGCIKLDITVDNDNKNYSSDENGALYNKDKTVICSYPSAKSSVEIPDKVKKIDEWAFAFCSELKEVNINKNVNEIGKSAFFNCRHLNKVTLPDNLKRIEEQTFTSCKSLKSIDLPKSVEYIGNHAFSGSGLEKLTLPEKTKTIKGLAFAYCEDLTEVKLNEGLEKVGYKAFVSCEKLKNITIPKSVKKIDDYAFGISSYSVKTYNTEGVKIRCFKGSDGERYAKYKNIDYELVEDKTLDVPHIISIIVCVVSVVLLIIFLMIFKLKKRRKNIDVK